MGFEWVVQKSLSTNPYRVLPNVQGNHKRIRIAQTGILKLKSIENGGWFKLTS